jgi:hypothetical protein
MNLWLRQGATFAADAFVTRPLNQFFPFDTGAHGPKRPLRAGSRNRRQPTYASAFPNGL